MVPEITFILSENDITKQCFNKPVDGNLVKCLEDFRIAVNETLTKMIEESGDFIDTTMDESDINESSSDEDSNVLQTPKKKRK